MSPSTKETTWRVAFWGLFTVLCLVGSWHGLQYFIDYEMYSRAAARVIAGDVSDLHELTRMQSPKFHYGYFYAFLFAPFVLVGAVGRYLFIGTFCLAYGFLILSSAQWAAIALGRESDRTFRHVLCFAATLLTLVAINDAFMTANIAILLAAGGQIAFSIREKYPKAAGAVMGMIITIKLYPALLLGFFLWERRFTLIVAAIVSVAVCYLGIPALFVGPKMAWYLIGTQADVLGRFADHFSYDSLYYQNLVATIVRLTTWGKANENAAVKLSTIVGCGALAAFYLKSFLRASSVKLPTELVVRMYVLAMGAVPIVLPVSWYNVGVFYAPLIAFSCGLLWLGRRGPAVWGLFAYIALYALTTSDLMGKELNDRLEFYSVPFFGALLMVLGFGWDTAREFGEYFPKMGKFRSLVPVTGQST